MSISRGPITERELDRHVDALLRDGDARGAAEGPAPLLAARTSAMIRTMTAGDVDYVGAACADDAPWIVRTIRATTFVQRIAAAVIIAVGAAAIAATWTITRSASSSAVAYADVAGHFRSANTLAFTSTVTLPGQQPQTIRTMMADSRRIRSEMPGGAISVLNGSNAMLFVPQAQAKSPSVEMSVQPRGGAERGIVDALRALADHKAEPLGDATIDGVAALAFRTTNTPQPALVWADKATGRPLRVELTLTVNGKPAKVVSENFEIDLPLQDSLFSLEPPPDYRLASPAPAPAAAAAVVSSSRPALDEIEEAAVDVLRSYAAANGGAFPDKLLDMQSSVMMQIQGTGDPQLVQKVGTLSNLLTSHPGGYGYAGRGVTLGEKNKIVFWYQPENARTYRAVYGDLRVANVTEAQLPADQSHD
jgi:outer membrane lipoprotein-sorting protein